MVSPCPTSELLHPDAPAGCLRSADQLEVQRFKRKLRGDRTFSAASPRLWNDLYFMNYNLERLYCAF